MNTPLQRGNQIEDILYANFKAKMIPKDQIFFEQYRQLYNALVTSCYVPKPLAMRVLFFPSFENEQRFLKLFDNALISLEAKYSWKHQPSKNMYYKFAIIDNLVLVTDSFNWTNMSAHYNDECHHC